MSDDTTGVSGTIDHPAQEQPRPALESLSFVLSSTGLGVWEVIRAYKAVRGNAKKLLPRLPHLSTAQLRAATVYYAKFPREIDAEIADDIRAHAEGRAMQQAIARRA